MAHTNQHITGSKLGLNKATYQGYEIGRRAVPKQVMIEAEAALLRNREFWRGLPERVDAHLPDGRCPNELRRGQ